MKKLLAIMLTLILTFSCFAVLGTTALAEETETVQLESFSAINGMFFKDNFQFEFKLDLVD